MYKLNTFAYTHLQFLPPNSLYSLARSVCQLGALLPCSPHYAEAVRTIRIVGWTTSDVPEGRDREAFYNALDDGIASLLEHGRGIYSLTLDLNLTKTFNYFPKTLTTLAHVRNIRNLSLTPFYPPTYAAQSSTPLPLDGSESPPAYERVFLNVCSSGWLPIMMRDPRKLRWFALSMADKDWQPGDANWVMTLRRVAEAATKLETLVLSGGQHFNADILGQTLRIGFVRGSGFGSFHSTADNGMPNCRVEGLLGGSDPFPWIRIPSASCPSRSYSLASRALRSRTSGLSSTTTEDGSLISALSTSWSWRS